MPRCGTNIQIREQHDVISCPEPPPAQPAHQRRRRGEWRLWAMPAGAPAAARHPPQQCGPALGCGVGASVCEGDGSAAGSKALEEHGSSGRRVKLASQQSAASSSVAAAAAAARAAGGSSSTGNTCPPLSSQANHSSLSTIQPRHAPLTLALLPWPADRFLKARAAAWPPESPPERSSSNRPCTKASRTRRSSLQRYNSCTG